MSDRNRAEGWKHAKLTGHSNEELVKEMLDVDRSYLADLLFLIGYKNENIENISIGGLHETNVPSVNGKKTKSKTDLKLYCSSGKSINISIKKSLAGQVYFVSAPLFISTFEKQFGKKVPQNVVRAIKLFWKAADDALDIIEEYADKTDVNSYNLQIRHESLNADTLKRYDEELYHCLRDWFADNAYELAKLSFSMGAVKDSDEWSEFVWYINLLGENDVDEIYSIEDICNECARHAHEDTYYGSTNGGTTIQLPFGFVQWHQGQIQFHHNHDKIENILK